MRLFDLRTPGFVECYRRVSGQRECCMPGKRRTCARLVTMSCCHRVRILLLILLRFENEDERRQEKNIYTKTGCMTTNASHVKTINRCPHGLCAKLMGLSGDDCGEWEQAWLYRPSRIIESQWGSLEICWKIFVFHCDQWRHIEWLRSVIDLYRNAGLNLSPNRNLYELSMTDVRSYNGTLPFVFCHFYRRILR